MLETNRLYLRRFEDNDIDFFYKYRNDPLCKKYQSWEDTSRKYLIEFIHEQKEKCLKDGDSIQRVIVLKETDQMIGDIFLALKGRTFTIGYTLSPEYWHHGYAREMIGAVTNTLLKHYPDYEIVALIHPDNKASIALVESLGFVRELYLILEDTVIYVLSA